MYIPVAGGMYVEAFHTPHFAENILSVGLLSKSFDVLFSSDNHDVSSCCFMVKGTPKAVFQTAEMGGLYRITVPRPNVKVPAKATALTYEFDDLVSCLVCAAVTPQFSPTPLLSSHTPLHCNYRTGHPSPSMYLKLAQTFEDVPYFTRRTLENMLCVPCQLGKARRRGISPSATIVTAPLELVHLDITGPVTPSTGGSIYSLSLMDSRTAKSDVISKAEVRTSKLSHALQDTFRA